MTLLKKSRLAGLIVLCIAMFMISCNSKSNSKSFRNSDMYDFANPTIIDLPADLDEISGISYYAKDTSVFAIIDEDGMLFKIPILHPGNAKQWRFDKQRDYEDIVMKDSIFYVLVSNGDIEQVNFVGDSIRTNKTNFSDQSKKVNEFETLYYDADSNRLVIMCKQCEEDKKAKVSSFALGDSGIAYHAFMEIDVAPIAKKLGMDKLALKPSAAAINPITKDLYIVCSVSKLLLITDSRGKFKDVFELNPKIYKQPEGLTFTPAGDLIISNEVFLEGYATLLILKNKKKGQ
ncbi:MAG: hypothetical protein JWQ27_3262 [Ferruginibacter sp.]|nr:hypothetical protein [Ferruginibacter sp.]